MSQSQHPSFLHAAIPSVTGGLAGALFGALSLAVVGRPEGVSTLVAIGLLVPVASVLGFLLALWISWVHPGGQLPRYSELLSSKKARFRLVLSAPAVILAWYVVGAFSFRELGGFDNRPAAGGVLVAASALGIFTLTAWLVDHGAELALGRLPAPSVRGALISGILILIVGASALVLLGSTSGVGGPLALFGVFRREELDLTPVFQTVFLAVLAYLGALGSLRFRLVASTAALFLLLAAGIFTMLLAARMPFESGLSVERDGGIYRPTLAALRRLTDTDRDGVSKLYAGGDCDDRRADVHPGAVDKPGNGVDEDCSGADRKLEHSQTAEKAEPSAQKKVGLPEQANFLLLTIDTLRFDLGYARSPRPPRLSPHLDALADKSTAYLNAYSLASYTSKSLAPMLIGRYSSETKRTFEHFDRFSPDVPWIQERLQKANIHTASIQGYWYFFFDGYGFERGWDHLDKVAAPKQVKIEGDGSFNGDKIADQAIAHLETIAKDKKRFFMWAHWVDPHSEYVRHEAFDFGDEPRERYDSEVAFVDAQIGRILKRLEELDLASSTVIAVTSDHGEAFGEHGMIRHGFEVWEELVRVPLLVHVPSAPTKRVKARRSIIDLAPTILETFAIAPHGENDFIRGTSLYRDVLAPVDQSLEERPVFVDMTEGPHNQERRAFYQGDYKIITTRGRVIGVYDLAKDPGEKQNLSDDSALTDRLRGEMNAFVDGLEQIPATR